LIARRAAKQYCHFHDSTNPFPLSAAQVEEATRPDGVSRRMFGGRTRRFSEGRSRMASERLIDPVALLEAIPGDNPAGEPVPFQVRD
jgi:hypothetical protein